MSGIIFAVLGIALLVLNCFAACDAFHNCLYRMSALLIANIVLVLLLLVVFCP